MLKSDAVHIWRDADGDYHLEWETSRPDTRVTVEPVGLPKKVKAGYVEESNLQMRVSGLPASNTHYFCLRDQHGTEVLVPERKLGMQGTPNFRDFGGYQTSGGRRVKWGHLYRSGQLAALTEQDIALLASLKLDLICDFRQLEEQESDPSRLPEKRAPRVLSMPITPGSNANFFEQVGSDLGNSKAMFDVMVEVNRDFALAQTETYSRMFAEILEVDDARFLVHCAAGKDRTGFAAAIILLALRVPREVVLRDYLLTSRYFNPERELARIRRKYKMDVTAEAILPMLQVHEDYLLAALSEIDQRYPSIEAYLAEELGVGPAELVELRGRYLD